MDVLWIVIGVALAVLAVLVAAAAWAGRSQPAKAESTPTQRTQNPYRRFYDYKHKQ